jgi:hypothetical protein
LATAGAMLSIANDIAKSPRLEAATKSCRPLVHPRLLFHRIATSPVLSQLAREGALPVFVQWGLWHDEVSLKIGAIRPIRWILKHCPEIEVRALTGTGLGSEAVEKR